MTYASPSPRGSGPAPPPPPRGPGVPPLRLGDSPRVKCTAQSRRSQSSKTWSFLKPARFLMEKNKLCLDVSISEASEWKLSKAFV